VGAGCEGGWRIFEEVDAEMVWIWPLLRHALHNDEGDAVSCCCDPAPSVQVPPPPGGG
jgi:hypothetical protein